jgi:hypothetical protein
MNESFVHARFGALQRTASEVACYESYVLHLVNEIKCPLYIYIEGSATKNPTRHVSSIKSTLTHACVEAEKFQQPIIGRRE